MTLPSDFLGGRLTLAMYERMGIHDGVAATPLEYITIAIARAQPGRARGPRPAAHPRDEPQALEDGGVAEWDRFLAAAVANATIATGTSPAPPAHAATPGERELPTLRDSGRSRARARVVLPIGS